MKIARKTPLAFAVTLIAALGCGDSEARPQVQGKVTYKGQAVGKKTLILVFDAPVGESFSQSISINDDGTFKGEVPQPGNYKVTIGESLAVMDGFEKKQPGPVLPLKYQTAATSDITVTIEPKGKPLEIELKD